jgi:uncharacterized protein (DUF1697 family)
VAGKRWAALLRGVYPQIVTQPDLVRAFEAAGFDDVSTVIASGNVVFTTRSASASAIARKAEKAMQAELGRVFLPIVRPVAALRALLEDDQYARFTLPAGAKRVVTFLRGPSGAKLELPMEKDGARILLATPTEVFTAYVPDPKRGGQFMKVIDDAYGKEITTRTWETVAKVVKRGEG